MNPGGPLASDPFPFYDEIMPQAGPPVEPETGPGTMPVTRNAPALSAAEWNSPAENGLRKCRSTLTLF